MVPTRFSVVGLALGALGACHHAATPAQVDPAPITVAGGSSGATLEATSTPPAASTSPPAAAPSGPLEVSGRAAGDDTIDVTGSSDLPPSAPSTAQPYTRLIHAAVAPTHGALAECARPLGVPARRMYRVLVQLSGRLVPRPPQPVQWPDVVARCIEGVVRGTTVDPPPPIEIPYDIYFNVAP